MQLEYDIEPCTKPRQTRADKWKQRPCVMKYRAFADHARLLGIEITAGDAVTFVLPMPKSWSKKKRAEMLDQYHTQTPDLDNLLKAIMDATNKRDEHISHFAALKKVWGETGKIIIKR